MKISKLLLVIILGLCACVVGIAQELSKTKIEFSVTNNYQDLPYIQMECSGPGLQSPFTKVKSGQTKNNWYYLHHGFKPYGTWTCNAENSEGELIANQCAFKIGKTNQTVDIVVDSSGNSSVFVDNVQQSCS